jgi:hypothetical protein
MPEEQDNEKPRRGRKPVGKRSNPDYTTVAFYIRKETYRQAQIKMLQDRYTGDASDLVEELLQKYLKDTAG